MLRIPFAYARANHILLKPSTVEGEAPTVWHSPETPLSVLHEVSRLLGPMQRIERPSAEVMEALNTAYSNGDLDASQVVDEVEEPVDLTRPLQDMPV